MMNAELKMETPSVIFAARDIRATSRWDPIETGREGKLKATVAASAGGWDAGRARQPESLNVADVVRRP